MNVNLKKIRNTLNNIYTKIEYILYFFITIILSVSIFMFTYYKKYFNIFDIKWVVIGSIAFILFFLILFNNLKKKYKIIQNIFIMLAIPLGILYIIFLLPIYVPDEQAHLFRAFDISKGNFITDMEIQREYIPIDLAKIEDVEGRANTYFELVEKLKENTDYNSDPREIFNSAESYPFIMYIPSAIVCFFCRNLSINLYIMMFFCRFANYVFFLILGYYSIKLLPIGKLVMLVYLFNPMFMQQMASISADSFINSITMLFIAMSVNLIINKNDEKIDIRKKIIYSILAISIAFSKYVYFPIIFISLLLLKNRKKYKENDNIFILILCVICILLALINVYIGMQYKDVRGYVIENNVNSLEQTKNIIKYPIKYISVLKDTLSEKSEIYFLQFLGYDLGLLVIEGNYIICFLYMFLLLVTPFLEKNIYSLKNIDRLLFLLISFGIIVLVLTGLYLGWTTVGGEIIEGVQGRYFLPVMILPIICLIFKNKNVIFEHINIFIFVLLGFINLYSICSIINFFMI